MTRVGKKQKFRVARSHYSETARHLPWANRDFLIRLSCDILTGGCAWTFR